MGFINRNTNYFKKLRLCLKSVYSSLVRSNLEFSSLIWSSNYITHADDLNNIQYTFLKTIAYVTHSTISGDTFHVVRDSTGLSIRRDTIDILLVSDVLNNYASCPEV